MNLCLRRMSLRAELRCEYNRVKMTSVAVSSSREEVRVTMFSGWKMENVESRKTDAVKNSMLRSCRDV